MKPLLKIMLVLATIFAATFLVARLTGLLSIAQVEAWFHALSTLSPLFLGSLVMALLFADLFIAVPTMTICILAGYFLGFPIGAAAAITGMMCAGISGHLICRQVGLRFMRLIIRDKEQIDDAISSFTQHGFLMILLSRATPILPEVTACLSGATKMPVLRFLCAWTINTVPFALITTYAGSVSSAANPKPAIFTAIALSSALWLAWFIFHRKQRQASNHTA